MIEWSKFFCRLALALILPAAMVLFRPYWLSLENSLWVIIPISASLATWIFYSVDPDRPPIPIFEATITFYAIAYSVTTYFIERGFSTATCPFWDTYTCKEPDWPRSALLFYDHTFHFPEDLINNTSLMLTAGGVILMLMGYYTVKKIVSNHSLRFKLPQINKKHLIGLLWFLVIFHTAYMLFPILQSLPSIGQFLMPAGYVGFGGFFVLWYLKEIHKTQFFILLIFLCLSLWAKMSTGSITPSVMLGLFFFFLVYKIKGTFPWKICLITVLFVFIMYPAIPEYRDMLSGTKRIAEKTIKNPTAILGAIGDSFKTQIYDADNKLIVESNKTKPYDMIIKDALVSITKRLSLGVLFSFVEKERPTYNITIGEYSKVPYWNGHTYIPFFTSFIPRIFWSNKPEERIGYEFRERYNFIFSDYKKNNTVVNIPWLIEMYVNFGKWGVWIGMFLNGILLALLTRFFNRKEMQPIEWVIGLAIFFPLAYQEANFSLTTGSVITLTIAMWCYFYLSQRMISLVYKYLGR